MLRRCLLLIALAAAGCAKISVTHITDAKDARFREEGVFYALPKTVVKTQLKVDKATKTPAKYSRFAGIFSPSIPAVCGGVKDCKTGTPKISFSVQQGATFSTFGEPDPAHLYMVRFSGGGAVDQTISMAWTESGLVSSASATVTNRTTDIVMSGLKLATSLGTKAFLGASAVGAVGPAATSCPTDPKGFDSSALTVLRTAADPNVRQNLIDNYCDLEGEQREAYQAPADATLLANALLAYETRVVPLVKARVDTLQGVGNVFDRAPLLGKLDEAIEAEIKQLFSGTSEKATWEATFEVRNVAENAPQRLLTIDGAAGVCPEKLLAFDSKPVPSGFNEKTLECENATTVVSATFALWPAADLQVFGAVKARVTEPANGERSFRYRLPAQVKARVVAVTDKNEVEHGSGVFNVAQLGHVVSLPARRASKQMSYDLAFIEATGGLKSFKLGTTGGLDAATIDALSAAGGTVLDAGSAAAKASKAERAAAETAADELTILTREAALLKLKHEICEIQKKYGLACTIEQ
jgi:hypothetical protein